MVNNGNKIAKQKINSMVDEMRGQGNSLVVQIMGYRGNNLQEYLITNNPDRTEEINGMFLNKEFVRSLETLKNIM